MERHKVLISAPYMLRESEREKIKDYLSSINNIEVTWAEVEERLEEDQLLRQLDGFDAIICGDDRFTEKVYQSMPQLKVIVKWGTGIDSIRKDIADQYGVKVFRTPNAFTEPVADTTLAYMLAFARNVSVNDRLVKSGIWDKPKGFSLFEKTVGIIGFGDIGKAVARRLLPFNCVILTNDVRGKEELNIGGFEGGELEGKVELVEKSRIWEEADIITFHCDLNDTSLHLFNNATLNLLGKKAYLINTARGGIIDEQALISGLNENKLAGCALDVFEHEPLPSESPLIKMDNVFLAAHNSNSSSACWDRVHRNSIKMLMDGLDGRTS